LIMTWPIVSPPFLAGLLAARNKAGHPEKSAG